LAGIGLNGALSRSDCGQDAAATAQRFVDINDDVVAFEVSPHDRAFTCLVSLPGNSLATIEVIDIDPFRFHSARNVIPPRRVVAVLAKIDSQFALGLFLRHDRDQLSSTKEFTRNDPHHNAVPILCRSAPVTTRSDIEDLDSADSTTGTTPKTTSRLRFEAATFLKGQSPTLHFFHCYSTMTG
jgi:hypothetical protein